MGEDYKKNRKFQYDLTKAKVDFQFWFAFAIGMLAIGYALISYFKDNLFGSIAACGVILLAAFFLIRVYNLKEERFKDIKKEYIDS
jgi:membrane protein YdbS with pleckstrin-like domain